MVGLGRTKAGWLHEHLIGEQDRFAPNEALDQMEHSGVEHQILKGLALSEG